MQITKRLSAGFMMLLMSGNIYQAAAAQGYAGNPQLMKDIQVLNTVSSEYNAKPVKDKSHINKTLASYEDLMGRKLSVAERAFLSLQFATMKVLPTFEVKGNSIQVYDNEEGAKDLVLSVEVLDAEKNTFKFGERVFQLDPKKPIHENIQQVLKELEKGEKVSFLQSLNPFAIPQAQAAMPDWLKIVLIGAVALVAGIFIGKAIQKNKDKDKAKEIAEYRRVYREQSSESSSEESNEDSNHSHDEATTENVPTEGEEPAVV